MPTATAAPLTRADRRTLRPVAWLDGLRPWVKWVLVLSLIVVVGLLDVAAGPELALSVFDVVPVSMAAWMIGRRAGLAASVVSALVWFATDRATGTPSADTLVPLWNSAIRLGVFVIITLLLAALRHHVEHAQDLARTDSLTGAANSRWFLELLEREIERSKRFERPFTLVYIDIDNFKSVNDEFGHSEGDAALRAVVEHARAQLRTVDVVARLGGDEFALLLPETDGDAARVALAKLNDGLLAEMRRNRWRVTFSVGAVTTTAPRCPADELMRMADNLMYSVKHDTKNATEAFTYTEPPAPYPRRTA